MNPKAAASRAMSMTLSFDLAVAGLAMASAVTLLWLRESPGTAFPVRGVMLATSILVIAAAISFCLRGIQRQVWRHMGSPDVRALFEAIAIAVLLYLVVALFLNGLMYRPVASIALAAALWVSGLFAGRLIAINRSTRRPLQMFRRYPKAAQHVLLVGDPDSFVDVLRRLETGNGLRVLGLIELENPEPGRAIRGVPKMGSLEELGLVIDVLNERFGARPWVAVTGAARARAAMTRILEIASTHGAPVMALDGNETAQALEPLRPVDLLARRERQLDIAPVSQILTGAHVLVTGGGGTIGGELARQAAALDPAQISLFDASEFNLHQILIDLQHRSPGVLAQIHIGDVRDATRTSGVFNAARADIVIHAAALKHVPIMEDNACEAVLTNVGGTLNVVRAAVAAGAKRFVFISTDKAVDPDNVMGATKRLAEIVIARVASGSGMAASLVRFGNVLGSSGSVVPLFERQIAEGGPVTITDPAATRFFMTIEEASALVLQAAALQGDAGRADLFVLDMGEPIPILQLAENMIRLKGKVPNVDIMIEERGLRPGEKLHEALVYEHEELLETPVEGVRRVASAPLTDEMFDRKLAALLEAASRHDEQEALRLLGILVPEYGAAQAGKSSRRSA